MIVYVVAYFVRPYVTDGQTKRYFIPALTLKIFGAIAVGLVYQFYYSGGDTFSYHTHGSRVLWEIFIKSPVDGINAFFSHGSYGKGLWEAADRIWFWRDPRSFVIIQIAAFFDLFTFSSYSATAILFSVLAFTGGWMFFLVFYKLYPYAHRLLAVSSLYIPSVVFWGSGILKDTVTLSSIGICTFCVYKIIFERKYNVGLFLLLFVSLYGIFIIKKYILICLIIGLIVWVFSSLFFKVQSRMLRIMIAPSVAIFCLVLTYFSINKVTEDDEKYSLENIAQTSKITAYDIRYGWGARSGDGSGYTLGKLDGSWQSMISLAPAAINVSLFRPYIWEVKNLLMVMSALEAMLNLFFTFFVLVKVGNNITRYMNAEVIFCLVFALIFAFGVGVSSYNFGTLSRYKIPLLPFYWSALAIIYSSWKRDTRIIASRENN
jgi:hypothetical protein